MDEEAEPARGDQVVAQLHGERSRTGLPSDRSAGMIKNTDTKFCLQVGLSLKFATRSSFVGKVNARVL